MINTYSVAGFVGAFIVAATCSTIISGGVVATTAMGVVKSLLRRVLFDVLLVGAVLTVAIVFDSEGAFKVLLGVVAYLALAWVWTLGVWGYLGLRWLFTNRVEQPLARSLLATWKKETDGADIEIQFDTMTMAVESSYDGCDGITLYDLGKRAEEGWGDERLADGWTEREWKNFYLKAYEVRRTNEGVWQTRLSYKYWKRQIAEAQAKLEEGGLAASFAEDRFEELVGYTWAQWLNRKNVPLPEGDHRPWHNLSDEFSPSVETAYQRYVHQG